MCQRRRSVQFNNKERVKSIPSLSTLTEKDIAELWYSRQEIDTVTKLANDLILAAEQEGAPVQDLEGETLRGLERKTDDGHMEAFMSRVAVYDAVLDEQDAQWATTKGELDVAKIARLCEAASSSAKFAAYQRAKQDEADIQTYLYVEGPFLSTTTKQTKASITSKSTKTVQAAEEPELDLMDVFSKSLPSNTDHTFNSSANSSWKADDSWITRGTSSASSMASWDDDESDEIGNSSSSRRSSVTARKVVTPAVPRLGSKKRAPPKRHSSTFKRTSETVVGKNGNKKTTTTITSIPTKRDTSKRPSNLGASFSYLSSLPSDATNVTTRSAAASPRKSGRTGRLSMTTMQNHVRVPRKKKSTKGGGLDLSCCVSP